MPSAGFEPAGSAIKRPQTYASDRMATGISWKYICITQIWRRNDSRSPDNEGCRQLAKRDAYRMGVKRQFKHICQTPNELSQHYQLLKSYNVRINKVAELTQNTADVQVCQYVQLYT
jgi:hypothetical protein